MTENKDSDWQVFISYSWKDNTGTEKKWVDEFEQLLEGELKRVGHGKRITLWRDKNQGENEYFTKSIPDGLAQSDLFIGLLSENFIASKWCPNEIEYFKSYWKDKSPGLLVEEKKSRFFKVLLSGLSNEQLPEPFVQSTPFRFYNETHKNNIRLFSSETAYQQKMEELATEIVNTISKIKEKMPQEEPEREKGFSLFVADVHDSLVPIKEELESRLLAEKIVLPEPIPPPMKFFEHSSKINTVVPKTKLSVHLLYPSPGRKIIDCKEKTNPWHQAELVSRLHHPQVILLNKKAGPDNHGTRRIQGVAR